jgi:hypothetical protein
VGLTCTKGVVGAGASDGAVEGPVGAAVTAVGMVVVSESSNVAAVAVDRLPACSMSVVVVVGVVSMSVCVCVGVVARLRLRLRASVPVVVCVCCVCVSVCMCVCLRASVPVVFGTFAPCALWHATDST